MKVGPVLALLLSCAPAAAMASASIDCETTDGSDIALIVNMDRDASNHRINEILLQIGGRTLRASAVPTELELGRRVINEREVQLELLEPNTNRPIAILLARSGSDGAATGTLRVDGRIHPVTCVFG